MSTSTPLNTEVSPAEFKAVNREMFNAIAPRYDFLNHFLSMGIDRSWRRKAISMLSASQPKIMLDVATGTGDFAVEAMRLKPLKIHGIDPSENMLQIGKDKIVRLGLSDSIEFRLGESENIPFADNTFDAVTVAFGVRNFAQLERGLSEIHRVLNANGKLIVLEFSRPSSFPIKQLFGFYFKYLLPNIGNMLSGHKSAYTYLHNSVVKFPEGKEFVKKLEGVGFVNSTIRPLTFGVATIYAASKR